MSWSFARLSMSASTPDLASGAAEARQPQRRRAVPAKGGPGVSGDRGQVSGGGNFQPFPGMLRETRSQNPTKRAAKGETRGRNPSQGHGGILGSKWVDVFEDCLIAQAEPAPPPPHSK